jgi:steroid 5-alpha reductase family enzyme
MGVFTPPAFGGLSPTSSAFVAVAALDLGLQLVGWLASVLLRTEKLYDFFGSSTFLAVNILSFAWGGGGSGAGGGFPRSALAFAAVCAWALRLGAFLTARALRHGDSRFEAAKANPLTFLIYWLMQAAWVFITLSPVVWAHTAGVGRGLWAPDVLGLALFALGWLTETVADAQKASFKADPANRGRFIDSGLWAWARYPNYGGEIGVWTGIWLLCCGSFSGAAWATVLSPLFVATLLLFVSGVPLQEKQAADRWGADPAYQAYRARSNLLVPLPFKCVGGGSGGSGGSGGEERGGGGGGGGGVRSQSPPPPPGGGPTEGVGCVCEFFFFFFSHACFFISSQTHAGSCRRGRHGSERETEGMENVCEHCGVTARPRCGVGPRVKMKTPLSIHPSHPPTVTNEKTKNLLAPPPFPPSSTPIPVSHMPP